MCHKHNQEVYNQIKVFPHSLFSNQIHLENLWMMSKSWYRNHVVYTYCSKHQLFLDESRRRLVDRMLDKVERLGDGKWVNHNRMSEMLLGVDAVGKTTMLELLQACSETCFPHVKVVFVRSCCSSEKSLVEIISDDLGFEVQTSTNTFVFDEVSLFFRQLKDRHTRLFLILDNMQNMFKCESRSVIQLCQMLNHTDGLLLCLVSGMSSVLRKLAFNQLPSEWESRQEILQRFPAVKVDLNSTKLNPHWIWPFLSHDDFRGLCLMRDIDSSSWLNAFIRSSGRPGFLFDEHDDSCSVVVGSASEFENALLQFIRQELVSLGSGHTSTDVTSLEQATSVCDWVSMDMSHICELTHDPMEALLNMADMGSIRIDRIANSVSLGSYRIYKSIQC